MSVADKTQVKKSSRRIRRNAERYCPSPALGACHSQFHFPAIQHSFGFNAPDAAGGRLSVCLQVRVQFFCRRSLPCSPNLFSGRIWSADRCEEMLQCSNFRRNPKLDYIKRIIGLPGDKIQMIAGVLHINGVAVKREKTGVIDDVDVTEEVGPVDVYRETLPNGVSYDTLDINSASSTDDTREFVVPEGHYFAMGDNRDNSSDSRLSVGFVPAENLVGRAKRIFFSIDGGSSPLEIWKWPSGLRSERLLQAVE